jgi:hypothetical protein
MARVEKRLDDLESALEPEDQQRVIVDWEGDGLVLDFETGERVTPDEWRKRYPGEQLVILEWGDDDDSEAIE